MIRIYSCICQTILYDGSWIYENSKFKSVLWIVLAYLVSSAFPYTRNGSPRMNTRNLNNDENEVDRRPLAAAV
jgi:hypothetical protein